MWKCLAIGLAISGVGVAATAAESIAVGAPPSGVNEQALADEIARREALAARVLDQARPEPATTGTAGSGTSSTTLQRNDTEEGRRYTDALNALSYAGFRGIDRIERQGDTFRAVAILDGRRVEVLVDPVAGTVQPSR